MGIGNPSCRAFNMMWRTRDEHSVEINHTEMAGYRGRKKPLM